MNLTKLSVAMILSICALMYSYTASASVTSRLAHLTFSAPDPIVPENPTSVSSLALQYQLSCDDEEVFRWLNSPINISREIMKAFYTRLASKYILPNDPSKIYAEGNVIILKATSKADPIGADLGIFWIVGETELELHMCASILWPLLPGDNAGTTIAPWTAHQTKTWGPLWPTTPLPNGGPTLIEPRRDQ